jgi:hypothetical protein
MSQLAITKTAICISLQIEYFIQQSYVILSSNIYKLPNGVDCKKNY